MSAPSFRTPMWCSYVNCTRITFENSGECRGHPGNRNQGSRPQALPPMPDPNDPVHDQKNVDHPPITRLEDWRVDGRLSRSDGPALVYYVADEIVLSEEWFVHGRPTRFGGPADVAYLGHGLVTEKWFLGGRTLTENDYFRTLGALTDDELHEGLYPAGWAGVLDQGARARAVFDAIAAGARTPNGVLAMLDGAPAEWVRSFEKGDAR